VSWLKHLRCGCKSTLFCLCVLFCWSRRRFGLINQLLTFLNLTLNLNWNNAEDLVW
jgi:hypothetical protein